MASSPSRSRRPSAATVIALIALFIALGGAGYAAFKVPKKSVGTKQLRNGAVTEAKLKKGAVSSARLKDKAVTGGKIADAAVGAINLGAGAVSESKIADGSVTAAKLAPGAISTDASTLNGLAANELARTAVATSDSGTTRTGSGLVLTTQITAPRAGFLVVNASSEVGSTADAFANCLLQVGNSSMPGSTRRVGLQVGAVDLDQICTTGSTLAVGAGAHTVDLEAQSADADVTYGRSSLQVLYVPFGPTGG